MRLQLVASDNRVLLNDFAGVEVTHAGSVTLTGNRIGASVARTAGLERNGKPYKRVVVALYDADDEKRED